MTAKTRSVAPIRKEIVVEAPQERAFRVFTENPEAWWPKEHHIGQTALAKIVIDPSRDGRWYEVGTDGAECQWGKVLAFEPPRRLVLAWQIGTSWQYDASLVTEVEVTFTAEGPRRTRVELEHRNLECFGEGAEAMRGQMDPGWEGILQLYGAVAAE